MTGRCERTYLEVPDGEMDYFDEVIGHVMIRIEGMMVREPGQRSCSPQLHRGSQRYQQWLKELERSNLRSRQHFTLIQHLMSYHTALAIKKSCRVKDALNYLEDFHQKQREDKFESIDYDLKEIYMKVCQNYISLGVNRLWDLNYELKAFPPFIAKYVGKCLTHVSKRP